MTSLKQIEANRLNALKSTGPCTPEGKAQSRMNALRHGLTSDVVVSALESQSEYYQFERSIRAEYQPRTAVERVLVDRLASLLWRLRRSTKIETGLFKLDAEYQAGLRPRRPAPEWQDERESSVRSGSQDGHNDETSERLAASYLRASRFGYQPFDLLGRYETALWRQAAQIIFMCNLSQREKG
jgi:hypothetical protein